MKNRVIRKRYYRISFQLASPLAVGSGEGAYADRDIIRDSLGIPYIPASAIAGVTRNALSGLMPKEDIVRYFGDVKDSNARESRLIFYDGTLTGKRYHTSVRDSVSLDSFKTAKDGAKFDMEILEPGVTFETYLEQNFLEDTDEAVADSIADLFIRGDVLFGSKSMRGYGQITDARASWIEFDLTDASDTDRWLSFDLYAPDAWGGANEYIRKEEEASDRLLRISLKQQGGISIRKYTTKVSGKGQSQPDMEQMTVHTGETDLPTIPGTSWAGAFRHHMMELGMEEKESDDLFGYVTGEGKNEKRKSRIRFGETVISGAQEKVLSRTAIDRFTGGAKDHALFTEKTYYGGELVLEISIDRNYELKEKTKRILAASVADLHHGFLSIGGETSIGRGLFEATAINGKTIDDDTDIYTLVIDTMKEVSGS